jgi:pilus assembly protein Flp/PilA
MMTAAIPRGLRREEGQGLVEYALIILLVSVALVGALTMFGGDLSGIYSKIAAKVANPSG